MFINSATMPNVAPAVSSMVNTYGNRLRRGWEAAGSAADIVLVPSMFWRLFRRAVADRRVAAHAVRRAAVFQSIVPDDVGSHLRVTVYTTALQHAGILRPDD